MNMILIGVIFALIIIPYVENTVYIFNTKDIASVEFYDCIHHRDLFYCRRPTESISLQRDEVGEFELVNSYRESINNDSKKGILIVISLAHEILYI
jgi:hypothetical protein